MSDSTTPQPAQKTHDARWLPRWEIVALGVGDVLVMIIFAVIGRSSHGAITEDGPVLAVFNTAIPLATAWVVIGLFTGIYNSKGVVRLKGVILRTLLTGLLAGLPGVGLRAIWLGRPFLWSFAAVTTGFITLFALVWRVAWSRLRLLWWPELR